MFAAINLRRLGQDRRGAMRDEQVTGDAESRVTGDPTAPVAATAIGTEDDFRNWDGFAPDLIHLRKHLFEDFGRALNRLRDASLLLHVQNERLRGLGLARNP